MKSSRCLTLSLVVTATACASAPVARTPVEGRTPAGIPNAQRVTVRGAGHLVNVWEPGTFVRVVRDFLEGRRVEG